jgi:hypothetical protein
MKGFARGESLCEGRMRETCTSGSTRGLFDPPVQFRLEPHPASLLVLSLVSQEQPDRFLGAKLGDTKDIERRSRTSALRSMPRGVLPRGKPSRLRRRMRARMPSTINERSNSAIVPMIWNISLPLGVLRSQLSFRLTNVTPAPQARRGS